MLCLSITPDSYTFISRSPAVSASHPEWFSSSVLNDANMVTNLVSKISTGPAMSPVYPLSQDIYRSHSRDELFQTNTPQDPFSATLLNFHRQPGVHQARSATCLLT